MFDFIKVLFTILSLILALTTKAEDLKILEVKNTDDGAFYDLYLENNEEDQAHGLKLYDRDLKDWKDFDVSDLVGGITLKQEGSYKVLVLRSQDFEHDRGGHFKLNYLYNGISGKRKDMPIKIDFNGSEWKVLHNGEVIKRLDFKVKKFFGKTIGIEKVYAL